MKILKAIFYFIFLISPHVFAWDSNNDGEQIPSSIIDANDNENQNNTSITTNDNVIVISQKQIQKSGATTLSQVLRNQAGIQLNDLFGDNSHVSVSMRGFGDNAASNSLILIDGFPLTNPDTAVPELNSIPVQEIDHIEIIQGSPAVLYGDQAVGGIVNIITRQPWQFATNLSESHGSYENNIANLFLGDSFSNGFNYTADGNATNSDNYRDNNRQNTQNILAKIGDAYSSGSWMLRVQRYHDFLQYPGALTAAQVQENPQQAQNSNDFSDELVQRYQAQLRQIFASNWLLQLNLSRNDTPTSGFIFSPFQQERIVNQISPQISGNIENNLLTTGIDIESDKYQFSSAFLHDNDSLQQYGIYGQLLIPFFKKFQATLGARAENQYSQLNNFSQLQDASNKAMVSEESLSYHIKPQWRLFLSREGNFRFPKLDENAFIPVGQTALQTQSGVSYETGVEWQQNNHDLKITLYQLNLRDEIAFDPTQTPTQPFGADVNLPPTRRNGVIISGHYPVSDNFRLGADYGYVNAFFIQGPYNGNQIPFVAKNIVNLNTDYHFLTHWDFYLEQLYTGNRFASGDYQNINGKLPGYALTNASIQYQKNHWLFSARVNNIFNKQYNAFVVFNPAMMQDFFYPAPGINFLVNATYYV